MFQTPVNSRGAAKAISGREGAHGRRTYARNLVAPRAPIALVALPAQKFSVGDAASPADFSATRIP